MKQCIDCENAICIYVQYICFLISIYWEKHVPHKIVRPKLAYVIDKRTDKYLIDPNTSEHLKVSIERATRIKNDDNATHKSRRYMSLHPDIERRYPLKVHTVNRQFERYNKGGDNSEFDRNYDESMTHRCAVEALSRFMNMRFRFVEGNVGIEQFDSLDFEFKTVQKEPYLKLPNSAVYYPDILCTFGENHPMYDQWGGKLAIEVTYTHGCESYKVQDFMFHNIPVLELTIEDDSARQFPAERSNWQGEEWGEELVENHIQDLVRWFSEDIVVECIVDPVSTRAHEKIVQCQKLVERELRERNEKLNNSLDRKNVEIRNLKTDVSSKSRKCQQQETEIFQCNNDRLATQKHFNEEIEDLNQTLRETKQKVKNRTTNLLLSFIAVAILLMLSTIVFPKGSVYVINWFWEITDDMRQYFV